MNDEHLRAAIEELLVYGPAISRYLRYLDLPGVVATVGPDEGPGQNRVALASFEAEEADEGVARVSSAYAALGHAFTWYLSSRSRPADLCTRLRRADLREATGAALAGMARTDLTGTETPDRRVERVPIAELRRHVEVLAAAFGSHTADLLGTLDVLEAGAAPGCEFHCHLVREDDEPLAYATSLLDRTRRVLLLGGAATVPAARGRGLYRALVHARIADAREHGCAAVVVQARRTTSMPILDRLAFREMLPISVFRGG